LLQKNERKKDFYSPMNTILIMIRNPELGKVKTRLAEKAGIAEALRIYHILLARTRVAALGMPARKMLFYSERIEERDGWFDHLFEKHVQESGDLGKRMLAAFGKAFATGAKAAVIIGSDCPDLDGDLLRKAFQALKRSDFVLGPTEDGGYYLLGMKAPEPLLFEDMPWSTDRVASITLERIGALGKTCFLLPRLSDIDTLEDWERYTQRRFVQ
jgi:uncharacterized protein